MFLTCIRAFNFFYIIQEYSFVIHVVLGEAILVTTQPGFLKYNFYYIVNDLGVKFRYNFLGVAF